MIYLYQITGPLHIPYTDPIWLELLHGYNVWVHVTIQQHPTSTTTTTTTSSTMMEVACQRMLQYSIHTSNMAAFTIHLIRLLQEYIQQIQPSYSKQQQQQHSPRNGTVIHETKVRSSVHPVRSYQSKNTSLPPTQQQQHSERNNNTTSNSNDRKYVEEEDDKDDTVLAFSNRIAIVEKARALAGALNLFRLLIHTILSSSSSSSTTTTNDSALYQDPSENDTKSSMRLPVLLVETIFTYSCRETDTQRTNLPINLLDTLLQFICCATPHNSTTNYSSESHYHHHHDRHNATPAEVYDCSTLALQLLLVLFSTQLYQPLVSSFQQQQRLLPTTAHVPPKKNTRNIAATAQTTVPLNFWNLLLQEATNRNDTNGSTVTMNRTWTARQLLHILLHWSMDQPIAPQASIQHHHCHMVQQLLLAQGHDDHSSNQQQQKHKLGPDGMYEDYYIVHAMAPHSRQGNGGSGSTFDDPVTSSMLHRPGSLTTRSSSGRSLALLDATKGVILFSSKMILLLPLRLMSLALSLWGLQHPDRKLLLGGGGYDRHKQYSKEQLRQIQQRNRQHNRNKRRTRDVLWLSMSPLGDLSTSLLLLLTNIDRHANCKNVFRTEMISLSDNRWGNEQEQHHYDLPDLPNTSDTVLSTNQGPNGNYTMDASQRSHDGMLTPDHRSYQPNRTSNTDMNHTTTLTINFEALFASFGRTAHTEPGALWLYTLLQLSPSFASAIAVRSDLDTIVLPLLRTLYYSTSMQHHIAQDYRSKANQGKNTIDTQRQVTNAQDYPYRTQSQLYVVIILLLILSQDSSFGSDAFRRVTIPLVPWYKERYLKDIRLGSVLILLLLRSLTFNLTRQHDAFLLTNCCAVLMNLSSSMVDLYDYTAMKFVTTTVAFMKRYVTLRQQNPNNNEDDITTPTSMYGEASRTLLCVLKHCLGIKSIEKNLHLVYALVYHQADFVRIFGSKGPL